jgi:hypothetical protein
MGDDGVGTGVARRRRYERWMGEGARAGRRTLFVAATQRETETEENEGKRKVRAVQGRHPYRVISLI